MDTHLHSITPLLHCEACEYIVAALLFCYSEIWFIYPIKTMPRQRPSISDSLMPTMMSVFEMILLGGCVAPIMDEKMALLLYVLIRHPDALRQSGDAVVGALQSSLPLSDGATEQRVVVYNRDCDPSRNTLQSIWARCRGGMVGGLLGKQIALLIMVAILLLMRNGFGGLFLIFGNCSLA